VKGLALLTLVLAIAAGTACWFLLKGTVPPLQGQLRLPGLSAPVEVLFDAYAVPHVYARDADDAWTAVGYLHARERLWQMEIYRRATGGRLSEVFGPATLPADRRFLGLGLRRAAAAEWQTATPQVRSALEHYAAGVNAATAAMGRWKRPPEFLLLGVTPEAWTPVDSLAVARLLAWRLAENRRGELVRGRLTRAIGPAETNLLMGPMPPGAPAILDAAASPSGRVVDTRPPGSSLDAVSSSLGAVGPSLDAQRFSSSPVARRSSLAMPPGLEWLDLTARAGDSNSWVIAGSRTKTGRPLLANDPHLQVEMPSI